MRRRLALAAFVVALAVAVGLTTPAAAQFVTSYVARTFTSSAPSGTNGFACRTAGCRVDLGPGAGDHLFSYGAGGGIGWGTWVLASADIEVSGGGVLKAPVVQVTTASALDTCVAGLEGRIRRLTGTGGTATALRTRVCLCTSDGAASPVYAWANLISGTVGTATTCVL